MLSFIPAAGSVSGTLKSSKDVLPFVDCLATRRLLGDTPLRFTAHHEDQRHLTGQFKTVHEQRLKVLINEFAHFSLQLSGGTFLLSDLQGQHLILSHTAVAHPLLANYCRSI